jgi:hypothetical protein
MLLAVKVRLSITPLTKRFDAIVQPNSRTAPGPGASIDIHAYGTADGTNYTGGTGTTDIAYTPTAAQALNCVSWTASPPRPAVWFTATCSSIAAAFGTMPRGWGIVA